MPKPITIPTEIKKIEYAPPPFHSPINISPPLVYGVYRGAKIPQYLLLPSYTAKINGSEKKLFIDLTGNLFKQVLLLLKVGYIALETSL